jgi:hypothetical protein
MKEEGGSILPSYVNGEQIYGSLEDETLRFHKQKLDKGDQENHSNKLYASDS